MKKSGPKKGEINEQIFKIPHREKLPDLDMLSNIYGIVKFRTLPWADHVTGMRDLRNVYRIVVGNRLENAYMENQGGCGG
jgi:hypothetical protein